MTDHKPDGNDPNTGGANSPPPKQSNLAEVIESLGRKYESAQHDRTEHDEKTLFWARVAGVGVLAYTFLTVAITITAICQVSIARQNFRMDQRPYLLVEDIKGTLKFSRGDKARWDVHYINYGKSPTLDEATDAHVWVGQSAIPNMEEFFKKLTAEKPRGMASFITPPNSSASGPKDNGFHYVSLFSENAVDQDDVGYMTTHDGGVVMAGRAWYDDLFGERHWTDFCRYTLITGAVSDCPTHNDVH
jgi:hypothetical protein